MDAFYASVELRDRPEIAGQAGDRGPHRRARRGAFGQLPRPAVRRALRDARQPGPAAVPAGRVHPAAARRLLGDRVQGGHGDLQGRDPEVEPLSLDEAFLDVSGAIRRLGPPAAIGPHDQAAGARAARHHLLGRRRTTKFVAKLASVHCKPDGLLVVPAGRRARFPAPAAGLGAVGRGRADRPGARPAWLAYGRRPGQRRRLPRWSASSARRRPRTCTRWPGGATTARSAPAPPRRASGRRRRSRPISATLC